MWALGGLRDGKQTGLGDRPCPGQEVGLYSIQNVKAGRVLKAQH